MNGTHVDFFPQPTLTSTTRQISPARHADGTTHVDETHVFGGQELHAFGHLVGEAQQVVGAEALAQVV